MSNYFPYNQNEHRNSLSGSSVAERMCVISQTVRSDRTTQLVMDLGIHDGIWDLCEVGGSHRFPVVTLFFVLAILVGSTLSLDNSVARTTHIG